MREKKNDGFLLHKTFLLLNKWLLLLKAIELLNAGWAEEIDPRINSALRPRSPPLKFNNSICSEYIIMSFYGIRYFQLYYRRTFHNLTIVFSCFLNIKSLHFEKLLYVTLFRVTLEVTFTCQLLSVEWSSSVVCLQFLFLMAM